MIPQPILDGGVATLALFAVILSLFLLYKTMKKEKKIACSESECMKEIHKNSIHNREAVDVLVRIATEEAKESVKQTTLLKIIARNGKGHLLDL